MLALTEQILTEKAKKVVVNIQNNVLNRKTGNWTPKAEREKMAASVHFEISDTAIKFYGDKWVFTYEYGRGPTVNPGDGAVRRNVLQVLKEEGIESKYMDKAGKPFTQNAMAFFISRHIHEKGTELYREGRKSGVLSDVINDQLILELSDALFFEMELVVTSKLLE